MGCPEAEAVTCKGACLTYLRNERGEDAHAAQPKISAMLTMWNINNNYSSRQLHATQHNKRS